MALAVAELRSDTPAKAWARALARTASIGRNPAATLPIRIAELAEQFGDRPALIGEKTTLSYTALAARSHQFARWVLEQGVERGDVVCLMMHNEPIYLAAWLGITRTGAIAALVNTNLVGESLAQAIRLTSPRCIVVSPELAPAAIAALAMLEDPVPCCIYDNAMLNGHGSAPLAAAECSLPSLRETALYIYTSGTTGLPKAAVVTHRRILQWSNWFAGLLNIDPSDRMYDCLPMYHSVGGVVAIGSTILSGGSVVLRRKFSARSFWDDVASTECTLFQYIGELCRFLVNAPPHPSEREHRIRIACGNGLRPDVWGSFQDRFAIPKILEFYAATEANFSLYNCEGRAGAIGRIPPFLAHRIPVALVAVDPETGALLRDERGCCRQCATDEIGEAIGKITKDETSPEAEFDGYTDPAASDRKIVRNVFSAGDAWFRSGDLMRRDAAGFFHFVDRVGETFRWRGENVSTGEVAAALCAWPEVAEAVVYGVEVPGHDGRAGMAAVVAPSGVDLIRLRTHLTSRLPEYAHPVFLRLVEEIPKTATFKLKKHELARTGLDPSSTTDPLFVNDRESGAYIPLTTSVVDRIRSGQLRI